MNDEQYNKEIQNQYEIYSAQLNLNDMSKMKELENMATWIADSIDDSIISNTEWAMDGTSFDELEGDEYLRAQEAIAAKTVEILYDRWFTNKK